MRFIICFFIIIVWGCKEHIPILDPSESFFNVEGFYGYRHYPSSPSKLNLLKGKLFKFNKDLDIYSLENGFDSVQLRIWFQGSPPSDSFYHVINIKKYAHGSWQAIRVDFAYPIFGGTFNTNFPLEIVKTRKIEIKNLTNLYSILNRLPLKTNFQARYDSCPPILYRGPNFITIEYALDLNYYLYGFYAPSRLENSCREKVSVELESFLVEIMNEFQLEYISDYLAESDSTYTLQY